MADYQIKITPSLVNATTEGSLDTALVNGVSIQRTAFVEVYNGTNRKIVAAVDGGTFNDTMQTLLTAHNFIIAG
jgi:hypothetical protein